MIDGPHAPGSADSGRNFVADHQDAVFVAQCANTLDEGDVMSEQPAGGLDRKGVV